MTAMLYPVTGQQRPITFDHDAAADRTDVVLLHLGHRLVQMCLRLLRAELWSDATAAGDQRLLSRVTARIVPGDILRTPAVAGHIRVVVTGAEGTRLHEEVVVAGGVPSRPGNWSGPLRMTCVPADRGDRGNAARAGSPAPEGPGGRPQLRRSPESWPTVPPPGGGASRH